MLLLSIVVIVCDNMTLVCNRQYITTHHQYVCYLPYQLPQLNNRPSTAKHTISLFVATELSCLLCMSNKLMNYYLESCFDLGIK